jgi:hypothetical protein
MITEKDKALGFMIDICKEAESREYESILAEIIRSVDPEVIRSFYYGSYEPFEDATDDNDWLWDFTEAAADELEL